MRVFRPARQSDDNRQAHGRPVRRAALLMAALGCGGVALLSAQPALSPARAGDDSQASTSESPSDVGAPAPQQPVADVPQATCSARCKATGCRQGGLRIRLLRCCRPCRCCCCVAVPEKPTVTQQAGAPKTSDPYTWKELFDGKTLQGWKTPNTGFFTGAGKVYVKDGMIVMEMGETMNGVTWTGDVPRDNYELQYEGSRLQGADFFATVTFPVGKDQCSLVAGGWGGTVVGLSSIDYYDAGDNLTTRFHDFKEKQWYKFRVRVTPAKIEAWIGDEQLVNQERKDHKIGIRMECELSCPLGFATYCTTGAVRNIRLRKLPPSAGAEQPPEQKPGAVKE